MVVAAKFGMENTFRLWNIPTQHLAFSDLRILPGAAESSRLGFDPTKKNPADPFKRYFNYPRAWYIFFNTGINQQDIYWMAAVLLLLFLLALLLFPGKIDSAHAFVLIGAIFSPSVLLAVERGNLDLFIFFICALALILADYSTLASVIVLIIAALFKLFPFFAVSMFLDKKRSFFLKILALLFVILSIYAWATFPNMVASFSYTEKGADLAYGLNVIPLHIQNLSNNQQIFSILSPISYLASLALFMLALILGGRQKIKLVEKSQRHLNAFRLGASIYIGTFFLGNNWDYRLIFLLFTIPQLTSWAQEPSWCRSLARWTLCITFLSLWYLIFVRLWGLIPLAFTTEVGFVLDELANWSLFGLLTWFMVVSAPEWLRKEFRATFARQFPLSNVNNG